MLASTQQPALDRPTRILSVTDPNLTPAATVMSPIALSRYESAGELLAWLPIIVSRDGPGPGRGHLALHGVTALQLEVLASLRDDRDTRPMTGECSV